MRDMRDTFRTDVNSAELLNESEFDPELAETWDDIFDGIFDYPLNHPRNTTVAVKRSLPSFHEANFTGGDFHIPHMFTTDDVYGERWCFLLVDLGDKNLDWTFLAFKPDRIALLEFFAGKKDLINVYANTPQDQFYLVRPNISSQFIQIDPNTEFPEAAKAIPGALYNDNMFIDLSDPEYGYNTVDAKKIMEFAKTGKFYFKG